MNQVNEKEIEERIKLQQQINAMESLVEQYMTNEAISRYGNIKSVNQEKALQLIALLAKLIQERQVTSKLTDDQLKQILIQLDTGKKETKIIRK